MGREVRRVPPNWDHPKEKRFDYMRQKEVESYRPMCNESYLKDMANWIEGHQNWEAGRDINREESGCRYYAEYEGNPPDVKDYRPDWTESEMTWFQVYETVSNGTPVTPPFETKQELIEYLVKNGDFWDQRRGHRGWDRTAAEHFIKSEWAPSAIIMNGVLKMARDITD